MHRIPANAAEFERRFHSPANCRRALFRARWPKGFRCSRCYGRKVWHLRCRLAVECVKCHRQFSLTAGTLFHATKLPLPTLFRILYMVVAEKVGTNAMAIMRQAGVSYRTALLWMRKIRDAMAGRGREKLRGLVEVDETIVGGADKISRGRRLGEKRSYVVVLAEDKGRDGMGRVRLEATRRADRKTLRGTVQKHIEPGSGVRTDGWDPYRHVLADEYEHDARSVSASGRPAHESLPLVHLVASLLKRFLKGTLQGSFSLHWLPSILEEFVFRINRRRSERRPLLFFRLLDAGMRGRVRTREQLEDFARRTRRTCKSY